MFKKIRTTISRWLTHILIYNVIVIDKKQVADFKNLEIFSSYTVETDVGVFVFNFKRDRRLKGKRKRDRYITYYVVEVDVPPVLKEHTKDDGMTMKSVIVLKIILWNIKPETLVRLLSDVYMDVLIARIQAKNS
ncbi:hypothetical protein AGENTSMITH_109 [Bacillus phage vB_BspM_AgentSmith]|nr:hypothetical protein AGENTSMITH_109 [Bacillus phage vB_BspM_AgentSmith]